MRQSCRSDRGRRNTRTSARPEEILGRPTRPSHPTSATKSANFFLTHSSNNSLPFRCRTNMKSITDLPIRAWYSTLYQAGVSRVGRPNGDRHRTAEIYFRAQRRGSSVADRLACATAGGTHNRHSCCTGGSALAGFYRGFPGRSQAKRIRRKSECIDRVPLGRWRLQSASSDGPRSDW